MISVFVNYFSWIYILRLIKDTSVQLISLKFVYFHPNLIPTSIHRVYVRPYTLVRQTNFLFLLVCLQFFYHSFLILQFSNYLTTNIIIWKANILSKLTETMYLINCSMSKRTIFGANI